MEAESATRKLIERAKRGDQAAFERLAGLYEGELRRLLNARLGPGLREKIEVADVVQETFLKALKAIGQFRWEDEDSFLRWLNRIATNHLRDVARHERRRVIVPLEDNVPDTQPPQSKVLRREERFERLQAALDRLSPDHRQVIMLVRIERLPVREVARQMARTPEATSQLLWRAMQKLKEVFGDTESLHLPQRELGDRGTEDAQ